MEIKTGVSIHNRHDIFIRAAVSGDLIQQGQAENIVLDRMYTRLLAFSSYFDNIVFGKGTGEFSPARTTLFNRVGSKAAVTEQLIRAYPTSVWTKSIRLGTGEFNGHAFTEIGISDTTTNINTHALITDAEGNPLVMEEKTNLMIIDIYSTVYVELYDVDSGLFFYSNGLRDYLTGGSAPNNQVRLCYLSDDTATTLNATRTSNAGEKSVSVAVRFNTNDFNKDVKFIDWAGLGIRCVIPRAGVFTSRDRIGVAIGTGDGVKTRFPIPNKLITNASFKIDGALNTSWTLDQVKNEVVFDVAPGGSLLITADYTCTLIPKDVNHVLDITMKMAFVGAILSPVVPDPDYSLLPGPKAIIGGTVKTGFYGETTAADLISGVDLCTKLGLTAGPLQHSDAGWLKCALEGNLMYVAKKTIRHSISWNDINAVNAVFGERTIEIDGMLFAVKLFSTTDWDKIMYPLHKDFGQWAQYTDEDLLVHNSFGNGSYSWTSTPSVANRVFRGFSGVTYSSDYPPSISNASYGFRPVLVFLKTL